MSLSAPKQWTFLVGAILWLLGLIMALAPGADVVGMNVMGMGTAFWATLLGGLVLILGNLLDGF